MSGGVTGKAGDSLPMSISISARVMVSRTSGIAPDDDIDELAPPNLSDAFILMCIGADCLEGYFTDRARPAALGSIERHHAFVVFHRERRSGVSEPA